MRPSRRPAAFAAAFAAALVSFPPLRAEGAGRRLTFEDYLALDEKARGRLLRRHVRRSGGYWKVLLDSYQIHTDISAEKALALAVKMGEFYRGFTRIFAGPFRIRARPELFALKDEDGYRRAVTAWYDGRMSAPEWSAGIFATFGGKYALFACAGPVRPRTAGRERAARPGPDGHAGSGDERLYGTLFHEGTHHLMHFYIGRDFPSWFDEGVATNFQDWDVSLSPERNVSEAIWRSRWPMRLHKMATGETKPDLAELMRTRRAEWTKKTGDPSRLYAQAWGIVNCLLTSGRRGQRNVNILMGAFRKGKAARGLGLLAPQAMAMLSREYDAYVARVVVPHCEYGLPVARLIVSGKDARAASRLKEGEAGFPENNELLYFKGLLALRAGEAEEALAILKPLEKRYPRHPWLTTTLGTAAFLTRDRAGAEKWLKKALRENIKDKHAKDLLEDLKPSRRP